MGYPLVNNCFNLRSVITKIILVLVLSLCIQSSYGQAKHGILPDSCSVLADSCVPTKMTIPERLERFALKDNILSKLLRSVMVFENKNPPKDTTKVSQQKYQLFNNKIVRNIEITVLGPFGYSVNEKYAHNISKVQKLGDNIHFTTRNWVIKEKLLFKQDDKINPSKISESERLIRQSPYVVDAKITIIPIADNKDSADVSIVVQDVFELGASGAADPTKPNGNLDVTDINFLGLGHRFENNIWYDPQYSQHYKYSGSYSVPQIANTYISGEAHLNTINFDRTVGFSFARPFFTATTKWAGGLNVEFIHQAYNITLQDSNKYSGLHDYNTQDLWLGYSFALSDNSLFKNKNAQLILCGRVYNIKYQNQGNYPDDLNHIYQNETQYLAEIGLSHRDYYKDHYIFAFGRTEDIPLGYLFTFNTGPDFTQFQPSWYSGFKASYGWNNSSLGYMYLSAETGGYTINNNTNNGDIYRGVLNTELFYFTNLIPVDNWQFRQYLMNRYTIGYNRQPGEYININGANGLQRFNAPNLQGTQRWSNNYEADFFTPYKPLGFQIVLVFYMDDALLGTHDNTILHSRVYQGYGAAVRFKNEHFIFNTLELAFHFFPGAASEGGNSYQFNSSGSSSYSFQDFQVPEPYVAIYK